VGVIGAKILQLLPDISRWIYARWMILSGKGRIYYDENIAGSSFIIQHPTNGLTCFIGKPDIDTMQKSLTSIDVPVSIIGYEENYRYIESQLKGFEKSQATLYTLSDELPEYYAADSTIRFVKKNDIENTHHIPDDLRKELSDALLSSPVAALFTGDHPVSFCYVAAETETLWDVAIDTLEPYRNRGFAAATVRFMIEYMSTKGKRPVWGAEETNPVSSHLAIKLGFKPIDKLYLFHKK